MNFADLVAPTAANLPILRQALLVAEQLPRPDGAHTELVLAFGHDRDAFAAALCASWLCGFGTIVCENSWRERIGPAIGLATAASTTLHDTGSGRAIQVPDRLADAARSGELPPLRSSWPELDDDRTLLTIEVQQDCGRRSWCRWSARQLHDALRELAMRLPVGPDPGDEAAPFRTPGQIGSLFVDTLLPLQRGTQRPARATAAAGRATSDELPIEGVPPIALDAALTASRDAMLAHDGIDACAPVRAADDDGGRVVLALAGPEAARLAAEHPDAVAFDEIPRDPNGQPVAAAIFLAAGLGRHGQPVARELTWQPLPITASDEFVHGTTIPADYVFYEGHFDGYPVLAGGVQLLRLVQPTLRAAIGDAPLPTITRFDNIKFLARFQPGEAITVRVRRLDDGARADFEVRRGDTRCTSGRCSFAAPLPPFGAEAAQ